MTAPGTFGVDDERNGADTRRWVRSPRVLWRRLSDGLVLLPLDAINPFVITGSSPALWDILAQPIDIASAADALAKQHGVTADVIARDIAPLLDDLAKRGAIEEHQASAEDQ